MLVKAEQEASARRESKLNDVISLKLREEQLRNREALEKLRITFDLEAIRFEKVIKDKAFDLLRSLKVKQLDKLIYVSRKLTSIHGH